VLGAGVLLPHEAGDGDGDGDGDGAVAVVQIARCRSGVLAEPGLPDLGAGDLLLIVEAGGLGGVHHRIAMGQGARRLLPGYTAIPVSIVLGQQGVPLRGIRRRQRQGDAEGEGDAPQDAACIHGLFLS